MLIRDCSKKKDSYLEKNFKDKKAELNARLLLGTDYKPFNYLERYLLRLVLLVWLLDCLYY